MSSFARLVLFAVCLGTAAEHRVLHVSTVAMYFLAVGAVVAWVLVAGEK